MKRNHNSKRNHFLNFVGVPPSSGYLNYMAAQEGYSQSGDPLALYPNMYPSDDGISGTLLPGGGGDAIGAGTSDLGLGSGGIKPIVPEQELGLGAGNALMESGGGTTLVNTPYTYNNVDNADCPTITRMIGEVENSMIMIRFTPEGYAAWMAWLQYAYARKEIICNPKSSPVDEYCPSGNCGQTTTAPVQTFGGGASGGGVIGAGVGDGGGGVIGAGGGVETLTSGGAATSPTTSAPKSSGILGGLSGLFGGGGAGGGNGQAPTGKGKDWFWIVFGAVSITGLIVHLSKSE